MFYGAARTFAGGRPHGLDRLGHRCRRFVHVIAGAVGIFALIMASAEAFTLLKRAGAVYLIWLGSRHGSKPRSSIRSGWR